MTWNWNLSNLDSARRPPARARPSAPASNQRNFGSCMCAWVISCVVPCHDMIRPFLRVKCSGCGIPLNKAIKTEPNRRFTTVRLREKASQVQLRLKTKHRNVKISDESVVRVANRNNMRVSTCQNNLGSYCKIRLPSGTPIQYLIYSHGPIDLRITLYCAY